MERRRAAFRLRRVQRLCFVFVAVVGTEVEIGDDLHRSILQCCKRISLQERVSDRLNGVKVELIGEMSTDGVGVWRAVGRLIDVIDRDPAGAGAGEDLVQRLCRDFDVLTEI